MPRTINFEGRRIVFPDDATDAEIASTLAVRDASNDAVQSSTPANDPAEPAASTGEPSLVDRIMDAGSTALGYADQAVRGIAEGATNIIGLPQGVADLQRRGAKALAQGLHAPEGVVDALDYVMPLADILPSTSGMQGALDYANEATADALGVERPRADPESFGERMANRVGQEIGAAALPIAGAVGAGARLGAEGARKLPWLARALIEPAAVDPAQFIGREVATASAAGMGAGFGNEIAPDSEIADIAGALAGGAGYNVATRTGKAAFDTARALLGSDRYADDVVAEAVADRLAKEAGVQPDPRTGEMNTEQLVDAIIGGKRISDTIPGYRESLADRTGNPGLAALEYSRQSGPNSGTFRARDTANAELIDAVMQDFTPQGTPGAFRSGLEARRDVQVDRARAQSRAAFDAAEGATRNLRPTSTPAARGNTVRTALEDARDLARQRTEDAYAAADVGDRPIEPAELANALERVTAGLTEVERGLAPQDLIDRVARIGRRPDNVISMTPEPTLREAIDLRSELQRLQRAALADPRAERGGRNAARVLDRYRQAVDNFIGNVLTPEEQQALQAARGAKFEEAEAFTRTGDPVAAALSRYEGGQPRMRDERVAGQFVDPQAMDRLFAQADTPTVRAAIRDEVLSNADTATPRGLKDFRTTYAEQIARFPGLDQEIDQAVRARSVQAAMQATEADLVSRIGREGHGAVARYLRYGDENAEKAMKAVLVDKDPARAIDELLTFVNDEPAAVEGARKVFWNLMEKSSRRAGETTATMSGIQPWMPRALERFLNDPVNRAVAERLWRDNPEHLENIKKIAETLRNVDVRSRGRAPNTSGTAQGVNEILTPESLQSRIYAVRSGRISLSYFLASIAAVTGRRAVRSARANAIERVLDEALNSPDAAALLLRENNPANRAAMRRKAKAWLGNEASTLINMLNEGEHEDETVRAAMGTGN